MNTNRERIERLIQEGKLNQKEAEKILSAIAYLERKSRIASGLDPGPAVPKPNYMVVLRTKLLTGEMDAKEYQKKIKVFCISTEIFFFDCGKFSTLGRNCLSV